MANVHLPVMSGEVVESLSIRKGGVYVDATVGPGGHSEFLLKSLDPDSTLVCLDRDAETLGLAKERLRDPRCRFGHARFSQMRAALSSMGISSVQGVLMDLGVSMLQLRSHERGFSFDSGEALDMRMDRSEPLTAKTVVNEWPEEELARVIFEYGEERRSRRIASAICFARRRSPIRTGKALAEVIERAIGKTGRVHSSTRTFQALRIAVNRELDELNAGLAEATSLLARKGRLVVIAYHSLEDRCVKLYMRAEAKQGRLKLITKKPAVPQRAELRENPSARSAKLRAAEAV
jgi:16S rRNA (cytosine1402-N4)-methyltransferase